MRIRSVHAHLLSAPLPAPLKLSYYGGERTILKRDAMLIRVEADNGLVGYAPGQGSEKSKHGIDHVVAPFLKGRTLADPDALRVQFAETHGISLEHRKLYGAVEIALYDLAGKTKGVPISELLGGRVRDRIRLYGSAGMYMSPMQYAEEARAIAKLGFRAYKMRPGMGPAEDLETVRQMRDAVGPDFDLMVDAHTWWRMGDRNYSPATIQKLAGDLSQYGIAWLEEPLPPEDHESYRMLKSLDLVPVASGEHEPDEQGYLDLIHSDCVDYVQMDVVCQGGYAAALRLLKEIERANLKFAFHSWGTALEVIAAAHLGVCWPEQVIEWLEYPCYATAERAGMYPFALAEQILKQPLRIEQGDLIVPKGPGLGVEVDEGVVDRYPWIPGPWSFFEIYSPHETRAVTADHSEPWFGKVSGEEIR
jgi:L-alanine-DL-glutamate epimerase-like enolase superfamily enzyme